MQLQFNLTHQSTQQIEPGYCQCGCGGKTALAKHNDKRFGHIKGEPLRYINHHGFARPASERFWEKVDKRGPDECWLWLASTNEHGYAQFWDGERFTVAHRFSYKLHNGPIPEGLDVLHKCDNPPCTNPNHLFVGTALDNVRDMDAKGRRVTCGFPGESHPLTKLTNDKVREIRQRFDNGESRSCLAEAYGVKIWVIRGIVNRTRWRHVE